MERSIRPGKTFHGDNIASIHSHGQSQASENRFAIEENRAGAAFPDTAPIFGSRQPELVSEDIEKELIGRD